MYKVQKLEMDWEIPKSEIQSIEKLSNSNLLQIFEYLPIADRFRVEGGKIIFYYSEPLLIFARI